MTLCLLWDCVHTTTWVSLVSFLSESPLSCSHLQHAFVEQVFVAAVCGGNQSWWQADQGLHKSVNDPCIWVRCIGAGTPSKRSRAVAPRGPELKSTAECPLCGLGRTEIPESSTWICLGITFALLYALSLRVWLAQACTGYTGSSLLFWQHCKFCNSFHLNQVQAYAICKSSHSDFIYILQSKHFLNWGCTSPLCGNVRPQCTTDVSKPRDTDAASGPG